MNKKIPKIKMTYHNFENHIMYTKFYGIMKSMTQMQANASIKPANGDTVMALYNYNIDPDIKTKPDACTMIVINERFIRSNIPLQQYLFDMNIEDEYGFSSLIQRKIYDGVIDTYIDIHTYDEKYKSGNSYLFCGIFITDATKDIKALEMIYNMVLAYSPHCSAKYGLEEQYRHHIPQITEVAEAIVLEFTEV